MKKKILSVLLGYSLLFGTICANAVSIEFEDLERSDKTLDLEQSDITLDLKQSEETSNLDIETDDISTIYEKLEIEEAATEENAIQNIDFPLATKDQFIADMKNELYPLTYDSEIESIEQSTVSQILKQSTSSRSNMNAKMASTIIDLTDLATGNEISHDCNLYLNTQYNTTQHWKECSVCNKKFNIVNHSCKDNGWTGGSASNCAGSNVHKFVCDCGYYYSNTIGKSNHTFDEPRGRNDTFLYQKRCSVCTYRETLHECIKSNGSKISCNNSGVCKLCGTNYVSYHIGQSSKIGNVYCTKCSKFLGKISSINSAITSDGNMTHTSSITPISGSTFGGLTFYHQNNPGIEEVETIYNNWSATTKMKYILHTEYKSTEAHFYHFYHNEEHCRLDVLLNSQPEKTAPVISNIKQENLASSNGWVTNKKITISGTENYCERITLLMKDSKGNIYLNNVSVPVSNKKWNYVFYPAIEADEAGLEFTITATDALGNTATKKFIEYKTDMKPPTVVSNNETTKKWSKTKDFLVDATDFGVGNVYIGFNNTNEYKQSEEQNDSFVRPYTFTGDVYGSTIAAIYVKDSIGNTTTQFITIYNLDNTAPTITKASSKRQGIGNAVVTITANDINTKLNASGSGVSGYAITQNKTIPAESKFQSSNTFNLTKSGTWYVWAIDAVGNISEPVAVDVKIEYTVSLNPNGGTLTGSSTYQVINGETITIPEPTRTGYTFAGWTVKGKESSVNVNDFTMGSEDAEITAQWKINQYPVIYIDKTPDGKEIGRTTVMVDYDTLVRGSDIGGSVIDNAYHNQYRYVSDTSAAVTTDGAVVYRIFEFCETEKESHLSWNDNNNEDGLRPDTYIIKLKQNGVVIDEVELPSDTADYTYDNLPKYDKNGNPYNYELETIVSDRYKTNIDEDGNLIVEDYQPANFSVTIPKTIVLNGWTGNADYTVSVNGIFYYNDTLTVIPESGLILTDRSNISSMQADVSQQKTTFTKEDGVASGAAVNGSISADRKLFAGKWQGFFNFNIKFVMQN